MKTEELKRSKEMELLESGEYEDYSEISDK